MKPYGYVRKDGEGLFIYGKHRFQNPQDHDLVPVYLHPKQWVGLTFQEQQEALLNTHSFHEALIKAEKKLKEKNT